ncbi:FecR family protein [Bordetella trematum]|uniref:FecR family protein n=1 Tax=Bordetella trematum TaxID=123899 RepID=UPI003989B0D5
MNARALEEASRWVVRQSGADMDEAAHQQFRNWYQASEQHAAAYDRLHQLWRHIGEVDRRKLRKRSRPGAASATFLAVAVAAVWFAPPPSTWRADYRSGHAVRSVALPDGSTAILDAESAIALTFNAGQRTLELLQGKVYIQARARQPGQAALQVITRHATATALGTRFSVQTGGDGTGVTVYEHEVAVDCLSCQPLRRVIVSPGQRVRIDDGRLSQADAPAGPAPAWSQGLASFDDMPLAQAAAELARYSGQAIIVLGAARELRVSGTVAIADAREALSFLLASRAVRVSSLPGLLIVQ